MIPFLHSLYTSTIVMATPLILCSLGGLITYHAGIMNVAMEAIMLGSAFSAVTFSYLFSSATIGLLAAIVTGVIISLFYSFFVITLRANNFAIGIAVNIFIASLTLFLTRILFPGKDAFNSPDIKAIARLRIGTGVPLVDVLFFNFSLLVYATILLVVIVRYILYRTPYGLWIRSAGSAPTALARAGKRPEMIQYAASIAAGLLVGLSGAQLSISNVVLFSRNMSAGRGFICLAAILIARGKPFQTTLVAVLFGFFSALAIQLQSFNIPTHFLQMIPYAVAIVTLAVMEMSGRKRSLIT